MVPTSIILDCDPGIDDAVAILLALGSPELRLEAITTVAGNTSLKNATANALRVLEWVERTDIPVAVGAARALVHPAVIDAADTHGETGLDGSELPAAITSPLSEHAVDLIARLALERPGEITLVATGPLTNVALLAALRPQAYAALRRLVVMGGSQREGGNITPLAEFNIWSDPDAAERVFQAGLDTTLVGLDVTHYATLDGDDIAQLAELPVLGPALAGMLRFYMRKHHDWYGREIVHQHDSLALAAVIDPTLITTAHHHVSVDTGVGPGRGTTLIDHFDTLGGKPNVHWAETVDSERFRELLMERLMGLAASLV